jgi:hypothetical protein
MRTLNARYAMRIFLLCPVFLPNVPVFKGKNGNVQFKKKYYGNPILDLPSGLIPCGLLTDILHSFLISSTHNFYDVTALSF